MTRTALMMGSLLLAACGGGNKPAPQPVVANDPSSTTAEPAPPPPMTETEVAMAKMAEFETAMCACKDADCAKLVSDQMTAWSMEMAKVAKEPVKLSEAEMKRATEMGTHMGECMQAAMGAP
jgi:hypothetical protein